MYVSDKSYSKKKWRIKFDLLVEFCRQNPYRWPTGKDPEYHWLASQRNLAKLGKLSSKQIYLINSLGYPVENFSRWESYFTLLKNFKATHPRVKPTVENTENKKLIKWLERQFFRHYHNTLSEDQINKLEKIGICFSTAGIKARELSKIAVIKRDYHLTFNTVKKEDYYKKFRVGKYLRYFKSRALEGSLDPRVISLLDKVGIDIMEVDLTKKSLNIKNCDFTDVDGVVLTKTFFDRTNRVPRLDESFANIEKFGQWFYNFLNNLKVGNVNPELAAQFNEILSDFLLKKTVLFKKCLKVHKKDPQEYHFTEIRKLIDIKTFKGSGTKKMLRKTLTDIKPLICPYIKKVS
jgi:hypothetical protein